MYYDAEYYMNSVTEYRSKLFRYLKSDKSLIEYFYKKLEFDTTNGKDFSPNDYLDVNDYGFTHVDLVTTLSDSLIISTYGKCEYLLNVICEIVQRSLSIGIGYELIKGQGTIAAVKYLDSLLQIDIAKSDIFKKNIDSWRILRNIIAHNYSVPEEKHFAQLDMINIYTSGETQRVVTSMNDCIRLIDDFESFFHMVFDKMLSIVGRYR